MPERTPTDLERRLHEALRRSALNFNVNDGSGECRECKAKWPWGWRDDHAPDCLAAPSALTKGDEG